MKKNTKVTEGMTIKESLIAIYNQGYNKALEDMKDNISTGKN